MKMISFKKVYSEIIRIVNASDHGLTENEVRKMVLYETKNQFDRQLGYAVCGDISYISNKGLLVSNQLASRILPL